MSPVLLETSCRKTQTSFPSIPIEERLGFQSPCIRTIRLQMTCKIISVFQSNRINPNEVCEDARLRARDGPTLETVSPAAGMNKNAQLRH